MSHETPRPPRPAESAALSGADRRAVLRHLGGEMDAAEAAAFAERLEREPGLAAAHRRLSATWERLEAPPAEPAPPGFAARVRARAEASDGDGGAIRRPLAPLLLGAGPLQRLASGAALAGGVVAGIVLGLAILAAPPPGSSPTVVEVGTEASLWSTGDDFTLAPTGVAEAYWLALEETVEGGDAPSGDGFADPIGEDGVER